MSKVRRNIIYNLLGQLLLLALSFASTRYIYRGLGKDVLGIIYFVMMLNNSLAAVLELGIGATATKEIAAALKRDDGYVREVIQTGAFYFWLGFVLIAGTQFVAAPWIVDNWIQVESLERHDAILALQILGPTVFLAFPKTFYLSVFRGFQRMGVTNLIDVLSLVIQQAGVVLLIIYGGKLYPVAGWIALTYVGRVVVYAAVLGATYSWAAVWPRYHAHVVHKNASFVGQMSGMSIFAMAQSQGDKLVMSKLLPIVQMGWYSFAYGAVGKGLNIANAVGAAAFPRLSEVASDRARLVEVYRPLQSLMVLGLVPVFAAIPFLVPLLFSEILDAEAADALWLPSSIIALCCYMKGTITLPHFVGLAAERPDIGFRQALYAFFAIFPLTVALIHWVGMTGAAMGWCAYQCFGYGYGTRRVYQECLKVSTLRFYVDVAKALALAALSYGLAFYVIWATLEFDFVAIAIGYGLASLVYLIGVWFVVDDKVRHQIRGMLSRIKASLGAPSS